jgi:hypothetical protein
MAQRVGIISTSLRSGLDDNREKRRKKKKNEQTNRITVTMQAHHQSPQYPARMPQGKRVSASHHFHRIGTLTSRAGVLSIR